jgi:hypothetical protein
MHKAYLAGLMDGEGSIMLLGQGPKRCRRPQIAVAMKEEEVLDAIRAEYAGFIREKGRASQWALNGQPALRVLREIRPHLVIERRQKLADLLLNSPALNYAGSAGEKATKIAHTEALFAEMKAANQIRLTEPPQVTPSDPLDADYAYLAGILDGEGWISRKHRRLEVWSTDPELPAWAASRFGGKVYVGFKADYRPNCRASWRWYCSLGASNLWAEKVAGHMLLERKRAQLSWGH